MRRKLGWKIGVAFHVLCGIRAIQYDRAEQRRHAKGRHSLNLTIRLAWSKMRSISLKK